MTLVRKFYCYLNDIEAPDLWTDKKRGVSKDIRLPSEMSLSRISHAKMVGFSLLYCSILATTAGVATFGLLPPIKPGGRSVPGTERASRTRCLR